MRALIEIQRVATDNNKRARITPLKSRRERRMEQREHSRRTRRSANELKNIQAS